MAAIASQRFHRLRQAFAVGAALGVLAATSALTAAWQHNPQGEFREGGIVHWGPLLSLGVLWFLAVAVPATLVAILVLGWIQASRRQASE